MGGEGSEVNIWDIDTGEMVVQFGDCHGSNEITAMAIDASGRRLITGSRKGDIKVCNRLGWVIFLLAKLLMPISHHCWLL